MGAIHTDQIEIQNITTQLKSSSSKGVDGVSAKIVKAVKKKYPYHLQQFLTFH